MKESKFIEQNQKKWAEFEEMQNNKHKDNNHYSKLFIQITDDLSYARTFYSNRSVRLYLNKLAQDIFHKLFSKNKKQKSFFKDFWLEELPSVMYYHRTELLVSFTTLIIAIGIGLLTYMHDNEFAAKILGDTYLQMTAENIAKKDPMAVYKSMSPVQMFNHIVINNLRVDIITFFFGIIFSIGSIFVLIHNGLMLSAFQFYFIKQGLFWESFLAVWLHGTLEISAMVICGAAGIVLGKGLVFPGTYSRSQAFFSSAQRATKIFIAVLPITIVAAIIEAFLTRYTETPAIIRFIFILFSLGFILAYFVYLPWLKNRNGTLRAPTNSIILAKKHAAFDYSSIKNISTITLETFSMLRKYSHQFASIIFWSCIIMLFIGFYYNQEYILENSEQDWKFNMIFTFTDNIRLNAFCYVYPILFIVIAFLCNYIFYVEMQIKNKQEKETIMQWLLKNKAAFIICVIYQLAYYYILFNRETNTSTILFALPFQFMVSYVLFFPRQQKENFVFTTFRITVTGLFKIMVLNFLFIAFICLLYALLNSSVYWIIYEFVNTNLTDNVSTRDKAYLLLEIITVHSIIAIASIIFCMYQGIFYFSQKEKISAEVLKAELENIKITKHRNVLFK